MVHRTFPEGLEIPVSAESGNTVLGDVIARNADDGVTWVHSYVSDDKRTTYCVYDAPSPDAIRKTAVTNHLPVDTITEVSVLDPYFYS
jgi:hypothetical protein